MVKLPASRSLHRLTMEYRPLGRTGLKVSALSLGGSSFGAIFRATDDQESIRTVHTALDLGINFIDVSPGYGRAEAVLGRALLGIDRSRYLLATKVGQYSGQPADYSAARITRSLDDSCRLMGVEHIDLLQCHDIEFADLNQIVDETLPALLKLKQAGRIGHIGITGLPLKIFPAVIDRVPPGTVESILSFCHYELNDTSLESLLPYCQERGIGVINASPTGMGLLTERGAPAWHPAPPSIINGCRQAVEFCRAQGEDIVKLAVQFAVSRPGIATTLIGTANPGNIRKNVAYAEAPLNHELLARVREILRPIQNHNFTRGRPENRDPLLA
jgi:L-galactose dehydrogenase